MHVSDDENLCQAAISPMVLSRSSGAREPYGPLRVSRVAILRSSRDPAAWAAFDG